MLDHSGQSNHGALVNGPTWTTDTPPLLEFSSSLLFDWNNDYIQTSFVGVLGNRSRTVTFWVRSTDTSTHGIVGWGNSTGQGTKWNIRLNSDVPNGNLGAVRTEVEGGYIIGTRNHRRWPLAPCRLDILR